MLGAKGMPMLKMMSATAAAMLALGLAGAACAQDEIVSTRPATIAETDIPATPPTRPDPVPASELEASAQAYVDNWMATVSPEPGYARSRIFANEPAPEPLPGWALEEPVRYAAEMCRPGVRPAEEGVEACFTRIEAAVAEARRAGRRGPNEPVTRRECRTETYRSQDGSETSSSYTCTVGTGDQTLLNGLLDGD